MSGVNITPFEKSVQDVALFYLQRKYETSTPSASTLAEDYIKAYQEVERVFKRSAFDPMQDADHF